MIIFEDEIRKLSTETGYVKRRNEPLSTFKTPIYLANSDSPANYVEISEGEYVLILTAVAEKIQKEFEEEQEKARKEAESHGKPEE